MNSKISFVACENHDAVLLRYNTFTTPILHQYRLTYGEQFVVGDMQNPTKQLESDHVLAWDQILPFLNDFSLDVLFEFLIG